MTRPDPTPASVLPKLLGLMLAAAAAVGLQAREQADRAAQVYAYSVQQSGESGTCGHHYIPLGEQRALALRPGVGAAADDGAALVSLAQAFELYQSPRQALVVSGNGYLAAADSLLAEDGADFSNDCGLPVLADNPHANQNRIYVYHDDLRPKAAGQVRQQYFPVCPRAAGSGRAEACTVVEWHGFERAGPIPSSEPLLAQAVLYHSSYEIAMQYASVDDSRGAQATVGLQGFDGRAARETSCNRGNQVRPGQSVCFYDPRHPPSGVVAHR